MISVIIPVYNVEQYLVQCLESIINQTYTDFEVILVDDGSIDTSPEICDTYVKTDSRVKVIHQKNTGVSAARNIGISVASGEWIAFIDSDDFVDSDYLASFGVDIYNADIYIQGLEYFNHRTNEFFKQIQLKSAYITSENLVNATEENKLLEIGFPVGKLFRKQTILENNLKFDTQVSFHEDHIFVLDYLKFIQTVVLSDSIAYKYRYYHTNQSLSSKMHPWKNLSLSADLMLNSLNHLSNRFFMHGSVTEKRIYHFAYSPKLSAVMALFRDKDGYIETKRKYNSIIHRDELCRWFLPDDKKGKLFRFIMLYMPFIFKYIFFNALAKYQSSRK